MYIAVYVADNAIKNIEKHLNIVSRKNAIIKQINVENLYVRLCVDINARHTEQRKQNCVVTHVEHEN